MQIRLRREVLELIWFGIRRTSEPFKKDYRLEQIMMRTWNFVATALMLSTLGCGKPLSIGDRSHSGNGLSAVDLTFSGMNEELLQRLTHYWLEISPQGECAKSGKAKAVPATEKALELTDGKVTLKESMLTRGCEYLIRLKFKAKFMDEAGVEKSDWVYSNHKTTEEDKIESSGNEITTDKEVVKPEVRVYLTAIGEKYNFGIYGGFHKSDGETSLEANINFGSGIDLLGTFETTCTPNAAPNASLWLKRTLTVAYTGIHLVEESYLAAGCEPNALLSKEEGEATFGIGQAAQGGYPINLQVTKHQFTAGSSDQAAAALNNFANGAGYCGKKDWSKGQTLDSLADESVKDNACKKGRLGPVAAFDLFVREGDKIHFGLKDTTHTGDAVNTRPVAIDKSPIASATKK